jgi:hypothetical protein
LLFYTNTIAQRREKKRWGQNDWSCCFQYSITLPFENKETEHFSKIFYEIGEHVGRELRPFLYTESFQVFEILCLRCTSLFDSHHRFSMRFKSGD